MSLFDTLARRALFSFDAETAHGLSIKALKAGFPPSPQVPADTRLRVSLAGLDLPNPVGMAAGYDKNAEVPDALFRLGFGFAEAGSITPLPQAGNAKPRVFRLDSARGVINRLGFNNEGHAACVARLKARRPGGVFGANLGANKDSVDRAADYVKGIAAFYGFCDYFTVNISSPNTPGLRDLQAKAALNDLLTRVMAARDAQASKAARKTPVFLKIAPDLTDADLDDIAASVLETKPDGLIVSNTTLSRTGVAGHLHAKEGGGLSGAPLFERSTIVLAKMRQRAGTALPIVGAGGIMDAATAIAKMQAGANAVQLYTGFIYGGPGLIGRMLRDMIARMDKDGARSIASYTGTETAAWAARPLPG
jgi:dihydroorotate dehydrogenase